MHSWPGCFALTFPLFPFDFSGPLANGTVGTGRHIGGTAVRTVRDFSAHRWHAGAQWCAALGTILAALWRVFSRHSGACIGAGSEPGRRHGCARRWRSFCWSVDICLFSLASFALFLVLRGRTFGRCVLGYGREWATVLFSLCCGLRLANAFPLFPIVGFVQFSMQLQCSSSTLSELDFFGDFGMPLRSPRQDVRALVLRWAPPRAVVGRRACRAVGPSRRKGRRLGRRSDVCHLRGGRSTGARSGADRWALAWRARCWGAASDGRTQFSIQFLQFFRIEGACSTRSIDGRSVAANSRRKVITFVARGPAVLPAQSSNRIDRHPWP